MRWVGYQRRYLADRSPRKVVNKSRRIGISEALAFEAACRACGLEMLPDSPPKVVRPVSQNIVSASHRQAIRLLATTLKHVEALGFAKAGELVTRKSATSVQLSNGALIQAFSNNPASIRGEGGDVTWDECAATPRADAVWAALAPLARPTLLHRDGFHIRIASTPLGDDNLFYRFCKDDKHTDFSRYQIDWKTALADDFPFDETDARKDYPDQDIFEQEFGCSFLSSNMRYIPREVYEAAVFDFVDLPKLPGARYGGMDVARHRDNSAIVVGSKIGDTWWHEETEARRDVPWDEQEQWVHGTLRPHDRAAIHRFCIDETGLGDQFAARLVSFYPGIIEPITFTLESKETLATGLKLALQRMRCRVRADDDEMMRDVLNLRRIVTASNNVRFDAPRDKSGHADRAWALALAVQAASVGVSDRTGVAKAATTVSGQDRRVAPRTRRGALFR